MRETRSCPVKIGDQEYVITSDDRYLDYIGGGFEPEMVKLFSNLIDKKDVVFDIGANIGCTAILFSAIAQKVFAFEPCPSTFSFLEKNLQASGAKNVILNNYGLGDSAGDFPLTFAEADRSGGFVSNLIGGVSSGHTVEQIKINVLDDVFPQLNADRIDFIKIDVEGFEGHVLRGAEKVIKQFKPLVVLELNHWCLNAMQRVTIPDFFDFLRGMFPVLYAVDGDNFLDLHNSSENYIVMNQHILHFRFPNILCGFDDSKLTKFKNTYAHSFKK